MAGSNAHVTSCNRCRAAHYEEQCLRAKVLRTRQWLGQGNQLGGDSIQPVVRGGL